MKDEPESLVGWRTFRRWLNRFGTVFLAVWIVVGFIVSIRGCVESNFDLADDSPLPRWFTLSPGISRADVTMTLYIYTDYYLFNLQQRRDGQVLATARVEDRNIDSRQESGSVLYKRIRVGSVEDVIAFKGGPTISVVRDPAILEGLARAFRAGPQKPETK